MPDRSVFLWNSIIRAYARNHDFRNAFNLVKEMLTSELVPVSFTFACLVRGAAENFDVCGLGCAHGGLLVFGLGVDSIYSSSLVSAYSKLGPVNRVRKVFDGVVDSDLPIAMRNVGEKPDGYPMVALCLGLADPSLLGVEQAHKVYCQCARFVVALAYHRSGVQGLVKRGRGEEEHTRAMNKEGMKAYPIMVVSALAASTQLAIVVLGCLGSNPLISQFFAIFYEMSEKGLELDESMFVALLHACCHAGMVKDGKDIFSRMKHEFAIEPRTEHYVHIVKLLGMARELEAYILILTFPEAVDVDSRLAKIVAQHIFGSKPEKSSYKVMLGNIYANDERWDEVKNLRDNLTEDGERKMPGLSWMTDTNYSMVEMP
ncbi:hypothetical protein Ancab_023004 [Ancistrocladus abbreviatus]